MSVYLVMALDVHDPERYAQYAAGAGEALAPFKIKRLSVDSDPTVYEGEKPGQKLAIIEFESQDAFDQFYNSPAYQEVIGHRHAASTSKFIMTMEAAEG